MKGQFVIASAGRTASTTLYKTMIAALEQDHMVYPIWDFSPIDLLHDAYSRNDVDYVIIKGETFHFIEHVDHLDRTTLILLTRENRLKQIISHMVALRAGRFHYTGYDSVRPFRVQENEFLSLAHLVLMTENYFQSNMFSDFADVKRWTYEQLILDFDTHIRCLGLIPTPQQRMMGVPYDEDCIENLSEVKGWASDLPNWTPRKP